MKTRTAKQAPKASQAQRAVAPPSVPAMGLSKPGEQLPVVNPHAAGIDVGATRHYVCVPADAVAAGAPAVRSFGAFTGELNQLVEWLVESKVTTVALESTGVYWIPLVQKLEAAGLAVVLVNARYLKRVPGRKKTDVQDCQWLQRLHSYGLLNGSFRPGDQICQWRTRMRHRGNLVEACGEQVQHMQRALDQMNVHLHHVVSDLTGDTGMRILDAIVKGERDPKVLVKLRDPRVRKSTVAQMEAALVGDWRAEHLWVLTQALAAYQFFQQQIAAGDVELAKLLAQVPKAPEPVAKLPVNAQPLPDACQPKKKKKQSHGNAPKLDLTAELTRICGVDLTQMVGLSVLSILILIAEIGVDMSRWRNAKAFCSWLGLCPGNKISGGRVLSSRTPRVKNRAATLLRTLATAVGRSDTWLGSFHRRMKSRLGSQGANTATARKLACLIYHLLKHREAYIDFDRAAYEQRIQRCRLAKFKKLASELGYELVETKQPA